MLGGSLVKRVLVHDGAVGARLIQASTHVRRDGGGAVKLLPSAVDLVYIQVGGDFYAWGRRLCTGPYLSLQVFGTTQSLYPSIPSCLKSQQT